MSIESSFHVWRSITQLASPRPRLPFVVLLVLGACAPDDDLDAPPIAQQSQAMMDDDGIDCANCVGGECVELHCFENWTQGGGGGGGPYEGGGGGGGAGTGGGRPRCTRDVMCEFACTDHAFHPCYAACVARFPNAIGGRAFRACVATCNARRAACAESCKVCR